MERIEISGDQYLPQALFDPNSAAWALYRLCEEQQRPLKNPSTHRETKLAFLQSFFTDVFLLQAATMYQIETHRFDDESSAKAFLGEDAGLLKTNRMHNYFLVAKASRQVSWTQQVTDNGDTILLSGEGMYATNTEPSAIFVENNSEFAWVTRLSSVAGTTLSPVSQIAHVAEVTLRLFSELQGGVRQINELLLHKATQVVEPNVDFLLLLSTGSAMTTAARQKVSFTLDESGIRSSATTALTVYTP